MRTSNAHCKRSPEPDGQHEGCPAALAADAKGIQ